jgi:anti-sigma B factor antagonist
MAHVTTPTPGVLALEGEIDLHESPEIKEKMQPLLAAKQPRIVIDLSGVSYIDSSGLALFIEAMQRVHSYGGKFALCSLRPSVKSIFEIARLDQVFSIFPDRDSALAVV